MKDVKISIRVLNNFMLPITIKSNTGNVLAKIRKKTDCAIVAKKDSEIKISNFIKSRKIKNLGSTITVEKPQINWLKFILSLLTPTFFLFYLIDDETIRFIVLTPIIIISVSDLEDFVISNETDKPLIERTSVLD